MTALTRRRFLFASAAAASLMPRRAHAAFPDRPITVIVPYAAGGAGDVIIRVLSEAIEKQLGQPLVIDARAKSHHAPPLVEDPAVTKRVDALFAQGGPLAGIE